MGWLFFLIALLGLAFPPLAAVVLAMSVLGVFAKGVAADAGEEVFCPRRKTRRDHGAEQRPDVIRHTTPPRYGEVIDVRCYQILPLLLLPAPSGQRKGTFPATPSPAERPSP